MTTTTIPDITALPITSAGYMIIVDDVALELTFDPTDGTYGLKLAWADDDDYGDGFPLDHGFSIYEAIAEAVATVPDGHPKPNPGCYGCLGTGTLQWAGVPAGRACSCVSIHPDSL